MRARQRFALLFVASVAAVAVACTPPTPGGGGTTTTSTSTSTSTSTTTTTEEPTTTTTSTTTTTVPDDPNGRYVAPSGTDTGDCQVSANPCATVQYATNQADASGDVVYVAAGTYPELVSVAKDISYRGANVGVSGTGSRGAESIVKGFRNPGNPGTTSYSVTINGFRIDPQGDTTLIAATTQPLVWLRGGADTVVENNVFWGGDYAAGCSFTCTTMTDYAFVVQSGAVSFSDNKVVNFRRPVNINQPVGAGATTAVVADNTITGVTSRGISIAGSTGVQMGGQTVTGNTVDGTGFGSPSSPAGMTISNGGNQVSGNTFIGLASGVYIDICKKFVMSNNSITGNTFQSNGGGVNINVNSDGGACVSGTSEGTGNWVVGGGKLNGLTITGNNFVGNTSYAIRDASYNWGAWNAAHPTFTDGTIDATCNWWNAPTGPSNVDFHTYPDPVVPVADQLITSNGPGTQASWNHTPWLSSPAPGGACDGIGI